MDQPQIPAALFPFPTVAAVLLGAPATLAGVHALAQTPGVAAGVFVASVAALACLTRFWRR